MGRQRVNAVHRMSKPGSRYYSAFALIVVFVAGCGRGRTTTTDSTVATTGVGEAVGVDAEMVATCEQFLKDLVGGTNALVDLEFAGSEDHLVDGAPFMASDVKVTKVLSSTTGTEVAVGAISVVTLAGGGRPPQIDGMRAAARGAERVTGLFIGSQLDTVPQPRLVGIIVGDRFESGDDCSATYTNRLLGAAKVLAVDMVTVAGRATVHYNDPENGATLDLGWALGEYTDGVPTAMPADAGIPPTPAELWERTPAVNRDLNWGLMPEYVKSQLDVFGIVVTLPEGFPFSDLYVRCELGLGYATLTNFVGDRVAVATLCVNTPTEIFLDQTVATFAPETWSAALGNRIRLAVDASGAVTATVETLQPGELEKISGMSRETLEARRDQIKGSKSTSP